MNTQELVNIEEQFGAHNYHPLDVVLVRGDGVWVYDIEGNKYLDCLSGYSSLNQGHVHPKILKALVDQASLITMTSRAFRNEQLPLLYRDLSVISGYEMSLIMNSGVEAVETAIKLARKWAYRNKNVPANQAEIIVANGNFHGRTITSISASTESLYREDFGPYTPGFKSVPYGDIVRLQEVISSHSAAFLIEPVQGEGGVIIPPEGYLSEAFHLCHDNHILFIADEIQTGLGRTGKLFACQHENVTPDITIIGKALSGGFYPVSAVLASSSLLNLFRAGEHGSTFGGNPLASAVARASLAVIKDEDLAANAKRQGDFLLRELRKIQSPIIKDIRGKGLLIGIELEHHAGIARKYCESLMEKGILAKETHEYVIRIAPPLIIDRETVEWALSIISDVLK